MSSALQSRSQCGTLHARVSPPCPCSRLPSLPAARSSTQVAARLLGPSYRRHSDFTIRAESSSGHVRSGSRTARDLQQAENEARGEIIDLNSGMDRIANAANSAAEKASSPTAANRFASSEQSTGVNVADRNGSTTASARGAAPVPPLKKPEMPADGFEEPLAHSDDHSGDHSGQSGKAGSTAGKKGEDVKGAMLKPSSVNSPWVRLLAIAGAVVLASRGTAVLSRRSAAFIYILAYATWTGSNLWTTFIAGITMFKSLPRQVFGKLQAKLFPPYFQLHATCIGLLLGCLMTSSAGLAHSQATVLGAGLISTVLNLIVAEPTSTKLMLERYDLENADKRDESRIKALYKQFGKWHGISSALNLVATVAAVMHGWWIAGMLVATPV